MTNQRLIISRIKEGILIFDGKPLQCRFRASHRRSVSIIITPEMEIRIAYPVRLKVKDLEKFILSKSSWIVRHLDRMAKLPPKIPPLNYQPGEIHLFLGKEYALRFIKSNQWHCDISESNLDVYSPDERNTEKIKNIIDNFYRKNASDIFQQRHEILGPEFSPRLKGWLPPPGIRKMKRKWGVFYSRTNTYKLNLEMIKMPVYCIDYVILHENCHQVHRKHDKKFHLLMSELMPQWKAVKKELEMWGHQIKHS